MRADETFLTKVAYDYAVSKKKVNQVDGITYCTTKGAESIKGAPEWKR